MWKWQPGPKRKCRFRLTVLKQIIYVQVYSSLPVPSVNTEIHSSRHWLPFTVSWWVKNKSYNHVQFLSKKIQSELGRGVRCDTLELFSKLPTDSDVLLGLRSTNLRLILLFCRPLYIGNVCVCFRSYSALTPREYEGGGKWSIIMGSKKYEYLSRLDSLFVCWLLISVCSYDFGNNSLIYTSDWHNEKWIWKTGSSTTNWIAQYETVSLFSGFSWTQIIV